MYIYTYVIMHIFEFITSVSNNVQDTLVALIYGIHLGDSEWSNQTNCIVHVSVLAVFVFERYGLLTNGISYPKFLFACFDKTSEDVLGCDSSYGDWWGFGGLLI